MPSDGYVHIPMPSDKAFLMSGADSRYLRGLPQLSLTPVLVSSTLAICPTTLRWVFTVFTVPPWDELRSSDPIVTLVRSYTQYRTRYNRKRYYMTEHINSTVLPPLMGGVVWPGG